MKVRITTQPVGQAFGVCGVVKARNGRLIHSTVVRPHGYDHVAFNDAVTWADDHGHDHGYVWVTDRPGMHPHWETQEAT